MAKLLNSHFLYPRQLELKKLKCDFVSRDKNQVLMLEIVSYETMPLQPVFEGQFKCAGDYCKIGDSHQVPQHLIGIVKQLGNSPNFRIQSRTIECERDKNTSQNSRVKHSGKHDVDVCQTCYHIYRYVEDAQYSVPLTATYRTGTPEYKS